MPRRPRVHLDGVSLHIVQRGHNRQPCFFAEEDYGSYLHWLDEALRETTCALHAYVLMTNHVHLLLMPTKAEAVPKLLVSLGRRYVCGARRSRAAARGPRHSKPEKCSRDSRNLFCPKIFEPL